MNIIRVLLLLPMTLSLILCGNDSSMQTGKADLGDARPAEPQYPREVQGLLKSREARDAPIAAARFSAAKRGEGEEPLHVLAEALTSRDDNQAVQAASGIMRLYGCDGVRGEVRDQALRQMSTFPTPRGALLLACLDGDAAALRALKSFEPVTDIRGFGSDFRDWETLRSFALAEAGDFEAKRMILGRIEAGDVEILVPLLLHSLFPYIRDRDILLALTDSLLDDRLTRPGEPTDTDYINPRISDLALSEFDSRFGLDVLGDRVPPGGYTEIHKRDAYNQVRELLNALPEGTKLPKGRRAAEVLSRGSQ